MTTAYSMLTGLQITLQGMTQFQAANTAGIQDEVTRVDLRLPMRPDPTILSSDIVEELLDYELLETTPEEVVRFSDWLNEKRLGVCFFSKAVEYLVQMRREEAAEAEEITQVRRIAVRRAV